MVDLERFYCIYNTKNTTNVGRSKKLLGNTDNEYLGSRTQSSVPDRRHQWREYMIFNWQTANTVAILDSDATTECN